MKKVRAMVRFPLAEVGPALVKAAMAPVATTQALALTHWNRAPLEGTPGRAEASPGHLVGGAGNQPGEIEQIEGADALG